MNEAEWLTEKTNLDELIQGKGLNIELTKYYVNGYDSPWKFWDRRNELWRVKA